MIHDLKFRYLCFLKQKTREVLVCKVLVCKSCLCSHVINRIWCSTVVPVTNEFQSLSQFSLRYELHFKLYVYHMINTYFDVNVQQVIVIGIARAHTSTSRTWLCLSCYLTQPRDSSDHPTCSRCPAALICCIPSTWPRHPPQLHTCGQSPRRWRWQKRLPRWKFGVQ